MESETIDLCPEGDGKFTYTQMTLAEEHYCQLVAEGKTSRRGAYRIAFDKPLATDNAIDQWHHRIKENRPDIAARINEYKAALMEERRELWMNRQWEALEKLWLLFISSIGNPELAMIALKAYHEIGGTVGWMNGNGPTTSVTINNANGTNVTQGALTKNEADAKIQKLLELTAPKEGGNG